MSGGFGGESEDDLSDILSRATLTSAAPTSNALWDPSHVDDDITNPFADLQSSYLPSSPPRSLAPDSPKGFQPEASPPAPVPSFRTRPDSIGSATGSPSQAGFGGFDEAEPYQPSFAASSDPFAPTEPVIATHDDSSPFAPSPFASSLPPRPAADLSDLLGEEKPILPSFGGASGSTPKKKREASSGEHKLLPESSIGKRQVDGHLAALLGLAGDDKLLSKPLTTAPPPSLPIEAKDVPLPASPAEPATSQSLSRTSSVTTSDIPTTYEKMVSPLNTGGSNVTSWPGELSPSLASVDTVREFGGSESTATANPGLRTFTDDGDQDSLKGGFGDQDSLRGTYSRSNEGGYGGESPPLPSVPLPSDKSPTLPPPPSLPDTQDVDRVPTFIITVGDPQKVGSAINVAAQHTVYTVHTQTTSTAFRKNDFSVLRRFSHFLWLYEALVANNPGVIVPGMPEKNAISRFDTEFVENRRSALQAALMKIVSHPMLVGDPDLKLFLESDTFSVDIKQRKIDSPIESKGLWASLSNSISGPNFVEFDDYFDNRKITLDTFETQLKALLASLANTSKLRQAFQISVGELQSALLTLTQCDLSNQLKGCLEQCANLQRRLRELSEQQSLNEEQIGGLTSTAEGYARLCGSVKLVFGARVKAYHTWQAAQANLKKAQGAHEKAKKSGRAHGELLGMSLHEIQDAERRALDAKHDFEDVSKLTKAEMARFDKEKFEDFKRAIADHVEGMVLRQREVVSLWQRYQETLQTAASGSTASAQAQVDATSS